MITLQFIRDQLAFLIYQPRNEDYIYFIVCKKILLSHPTSYHDDNYVNYDYDYEFIIKSSDDPTIVFHVTCKVIPNPLSLIFNLLCGFDSDVTELKRRYLLTLHQKLSLEQDLERILPTYFPQHPISDSETTLDSNENLNSSRDTIDSDTQ
ncbi:hypothetical protein RhiirA5_504264 [Rhizophagus irregularis]|uniref:Uncharacterized protein n=1 Tax=Rhizophagus irregularis TaxID=588596 RepID=A0A2I1EVI5_9GLOM|nr:hypothetical protein RhiirA5_504264 [Rhizophagus irregularis]PKY26120.1 hypothetical protein RhiirB3_528363 [Rhizophagus irregularis]CAB5094589.1 unnamed protein product [Rhizophagus irregularis]CAB5395861.1 unnamed protein product [Rhizophagus irregularis]